MANIDYASLKKGGFMRQKQKGYFSLRIQVVGGNLTAENIKAVAEVAEKYGKGVLTIEELHPYPCIMYELDSDAPSVLQEEMLVPDFYPQKVTIVNGLYQSLMVMQKCQGYDLGTGFISESNGAQGAIKRPIKGFDDPITIGWVCQKAHTLSQPAERFIQLLQKYGRDLPEA